MLPQSYIPQVFLMLLGLMILIYGIAGVATRGENRVVKIIDDKLSKRPKKIRYAVYFCMIVCGIWMMVAPYAVYLFL